MLESLLGQPLQPEDWDWLAQFELSDRARAIAFDLSPSTIQPVIAQRAEILRLLYPSFSQWCSRTLGNPIDSIATLWMLWLPLAQRLADQRSRLERPFIQGILGGQGTGKTTLGAILTLILEQIGYQTLSWSLDDLYKPYADRRLMQQHDPRLRWRGPPGTHDVQLGIQVLDQLRQPIPHHALQIPRFDKSLHDGTGDRTTPEQVENIDITLFEGWFVGVQPIDPIAFESAPPPILTPDDRAFAQEMNTRLQDYLPLWQRLDSLWVLEPSDYRLSQQWRKQAEHQMKAAGKPGMTDAAIAEFVQYFWKALHPELFMPPTLQRADLMIEINPDHSPGKVFTKRDSRIDPPTPEGI